MDGNTSESSFNQRARSLGWKTRSAEDSPHDNTPPLNSRLSISQSRSTEKKQGESRRTTKRLQEEAKDGVAQAAPTTDITALMDNYFFFNAAHAAAANKAGLFSREKQHVSEYDNNGAHDINLYQDNEEWESRFVRTLEWVGEASKVISPSSRGSRSSRGPINNTGLLATNSLEIVSTNNEVSEFNKVTNIGNLNNARNNMNASISRDSVGEVAKSTDAFISRDDLEGASFRLPPASAISRGDIHATSFRVPQKPPSRVISDHSSAYGDLNIPSFRAKEGGPSATCKLPCQSCGNGPVKDFKADNVQGHNNHGYDNQGYINAEKVYSKPNYAMGLYHRNDRLARSAHHPNLQRRVPPNENENPLRTQKSTNSNKEAKKDATNKEAKKDATNKEIQQQKEKATDKALKEASANKASPAAKVQQWFSKLIGIKSPKQENAKASKSSSKAPTKANTDQPTKKPPLRADYELVIHGATMHDVLTNKPDVVVHNQASKPRLEETQPQLKHQPPQAPPLLPKPRPTSANPRANLAANPASKTSAIAPMTTSHEEQRGSSRRFVDDAHSQRFGYGSKSERWIPKHDPQAQAKESYQQDKQRMMQAPITYSKSARSSPGKADQQQQNFVRPVVSSSKPNVSGNENTAMLVNQERINQKHYMDGVEGRDLARLRRNQEIGLEAMPHVISKVTQEDIYNQSRQIDVKQYEKEINVINDRRDRSIGGNEYNPRAFVASYASQSERFSQRHHVQREYESIRRSTDIKGGPDDVFTKKGTHATKGGVIHRDQIIAQAPPPPPDEDRDIEVLNNFLIQKRANLHLCSHDSRLHFILSNSSISSMIAALCYAWILHNSKMNESDGWERVPVMSITRKNMWNYKQLAWLFEQAGLDTQAIIFMNEVNLSAIADSVEEYRISTIGQDIIRLREEVASFCTLVAEAFFKEVESSVQPKCIRILLLAGLLIDTENLDSTSVRYTRRDEIAASYLLPGAGHKGRAVLLAELKQGNASKDFHNIMRENYGEEPSNDMDRSFEDASVYLKQKIVKINETSANAKTQSDKEDPTSYMNSISSAEHYHPDFFSEDNSSIARSRSSKSYSSASTNSTDQGKSRSSSISPPLVHRNSSDNKHLIQPRAHEESNT